MIEEKDIPAEGKVSPYRVTEDLINSKIKNKTYTILPSGKAMICEITLENGFTVRGEAAVVDLKNFVKEIGEKISYENAYNKIWELEGYLMQQKKFEDGK